MLLVTMTAPIRMSSKTAEIIELRIEALVANKTHRATRLEAHGNAIRLKISKHPHKSTKFIGFIHNPSTRSTDLLRLAENWLKA